MSVDEKNDCNNCNVHRNMSKFNQVSIIEGIDEINGQLLEITKTIGNSADNDTNVKHQILTVTYKLKHIRDKCENSEVKRKGGRLERQNSKTVIKKPIENAKYSQDDLEGYVQDTRSVFS